MSIEHIMQGMALDGQPCCRCGESVQLVGYGTGMIDSEPNGLLVTDDPDGVKVFCFDCNAEYLKENREG